MGSHAQPSDRQFIRIFFKGKLAVEVEDNSTWDFFSSLKKYKIEKIPQNVFISLSKLSTHAN